MMPLLCQSYLLLLILYLDNSLNLLFSWKYILIPAFATLYQGDVSFFFTFTQGILSFEIAFNSSPEKLKQNSWAISVISFAVKAFRIELSNSLFCWSSARNALIWSTVNVEGFYLYEHIIMMCNWFSSNKKSLKVA